MSWPLPKSLLPSPMNDPLTSYWAGPYDVAKLYSSSDNGQRQGEDPPRVSLDNAKILPPDGGSPHSRTVRANAPRAHLGHTSASLLPRPPSVPVSGANRSHIANHRSLPQSAASGKRWRGAAFQNKQLALSQTDSRIKRVGDLRRDPPRAPISFAPTNFIRDVGPSAMKLNSHNPSDTAPSVSKPRDPRPRHKYHPKYSSINWKVMHKQYYLSDTRPDMGSASYRSLPVAQNTRRPSQLPSDKGVHSAALAGEQVSIEGTPNANVLRTGSMPATLHSSTRQFQLESSKMSKQHPQRSRINRAPTKGKKAKPMAPSSAVANQAGEPHLRGTRKFSQSNGIHSSQRGVKAPAVSLARSQAPYRNFVMKGPRPSPALNPSARARPVPPHGLTQADSSGNMVVPNASSNFSAESGGIPQGPKLLSSRSTALHRSASMHRHPAFPLRLRLLTQTEIKSNRALHSAALARSELKMGAKPASSAYSFHRLSVTGHATHTGFDVDPPSASSKSARLVGSCGESPGSASKLSVAPRKLQCSTKCSINVPAKRHASKNARKAEGSFAGWGYPPSEIVDAPARHERTSISTAASSTPPVTPQDPKAELPAIFDARDAKDWEGDSNRAGHDPLKWQIIGFSDAARPRGRKNTGAEGISEQESSLPATENKAQMTWNHLATLGLRSSPIEDSIWHSPLGTPLSSSSDSSFIHATFIPEPMVAFDTPIIIQQNRSLKDDQFGPKRELLARFAQRKNIKVTWASDHKGTSTRQPNDIDHHLHLHPDVVCTLTALRSPI